MDQSKLNYNYEIMFTNLIFSYIIVKLYIHYIII